MPERRLENSLIAALRSFRDSQAAIPAPEPVLMSALIDHAVATMTTSHGLKVDNPTPQAKAMLLDDMAGMACGMEQSVPFLPEAAKDFRVIIVGAGASGICMGIKLGLAGKITLTFYYNVA